jgi:N-acetylglucosaminyldiphosphoundecaprenol N-acetyl-beta-D-mannosaminyltransferase
MRQYRIAAWDLTKLKASFRFSPAVRFFMATTATEALAEPQRRRVLGIPVDVTADVLSAACRLQAAGGGQIVTLNAEMTMAARLDRPLAKAIEAAQLVIPDGAGVVWALARQGVRVRRSPGIELAQDLLRHAAAQGWRVALVGATPVVMEQLVVRLPQRFPGLRLVFSAHGYQDPGQWPELEAQLLAAQPDLVLVALGIPRQETWSSRLSQGRGGLWMGVGGSFDVWAGQKKRAPRWMGALQVEWLYRLIQEPHRWRRMLALPQFAVAVLFNS